ncbi:sugar ABC transporter substrate-binding protein [Ectobacillus funiculus]|uniref:sugar ABC transporter substrate-binding protein n=1 Tax=Ectobacillus funiculus TaxID=137993 RepID=UPI00196AEEFD|nr:sugar ABC transporter substrate-binding protein [Ectobacillus funiculus]
MKKKQRIPLISSLLLVIVIGCIVKFRGTDDRPRVVVVLQELDSQYWNIVKAGAEKGFQEFDINGKVVAPGNTSKKDALEYTLKGILNERPDVLVVAPDASSPAVMSILKEFVENKIPVLLVDTDIPLEHKASYIGTDNFELGRKAGELLASQLQPGDEVALPFLAEDLTYPVSGNRIKGATVSLENAGIKVATEQLNVSNKASTTREIMTAILQKHPDIKGVYATTDTKAMDALEVIKEQGLNMPVIGADGISEMIELIEKGTLTGTVAQNPYDMGYISIETALKVIKGEDVKKNIDTGVDVISKDNAKLKLDFLRELLK